MTTTLTPDYSNLFNVLGLKAICTSNRDIIFNFNSLHGQQMTPLLITKTNGSYRIVIPQLILKNNDYFRSRKSYEKMKTSHVPHKGFFCIDRLFF